MTAEHPPAAARRPSEGERFGLSEDERLLCRVSHARLLALLEEEVTQAHRVQEAANSFGEFVFLTLSRPGGEGRACLTFYGLGYHELRERWFTAEWAWYPASPSPELLAERLDKATVQAQLEQRLQDILPQVGQSQQTRRGRLFELLADLTDDDGAMAELEDLGDLAEWLLGDGE